MLVEPELDELEEMDDGLILIGLTPQLLLVVVTLKLVVVVGLLPPLPPLTPIELLPLLRDVRAEIEGSSAVRFVLEDLIDPLVVKGDEACNMPLVEAEDRRRFSLLTLCILIF